MNEPNCKTCAREKHCFVKEFRVLSCEDYKPAGGVKERKMFNQQNDILFNVFSVLFALQNLQKNREQSAHNDVQIANDNQAKLILTEINGKFAEQNKMLEEIIGTQREMLRIVEEVQNGNN